MNARVVLPVVGLRRRRWSPRGSLLTRVVRLTVALALALSGAAAIAARTWAATPSTPYDAVAMKPPDIQTRARFGRPTSAGDLNHDGVPDLWAAARDVDSGGVPAVGRVYAVNGRTRTVLFRIEAPHPQANENFAQSLAGSAFGDITGDGISELAVGAAGDAAAFDVGTGCGTPEPNACFEDMGRVYVFNGANGGLLYFIDNPFPQGSATPVNRPRFGYNVASAGDVTGDGRNDLLVTAPGNNNPPNCASQTPLPAGCRQGEGQAFIFNGVNGALIRTLNFPPEDRQPPTGTTCPGICPGFGFSGSSPGDVNGDGVADQQIGAFNSTYSGSGAPCKAPEPNGCNESQGAIYLFSGATGNLIRRIDPPFSHTTPIVFGYQSIESGAPGDVNGDGRADVYGSMSEEGLFKGSGFVFNGASGALLYALQRPGFGLGDCYYGMAKTDYNKDGTPDLYLGASSCNSALADPNGATYVFNGKNGTLLKSLLMPEADRQGSGPGDSGPLLGTYVAAPGDLNGDGEPDYVAGASNYNEGAVVDAGRLYFFLSQVPPRPPAPRRYDVPVNPSSTAFPGCATSTANVIRGTAASNSITGTPRADRIFAGTGDDTVDGLASNDCIDLGPGTDRGQGGTGNDLIVGGLGRDRAAGSSGNDRLLGGASADRLIGGLGNDRLHGQSGSDRINGERGRDRVNGGSSNDTISAGSSNDRAAGDQGNDSVSGNSGNDSLLGNSGRDRLSGGSGRDRISGGSGNDRVSARDGQRDRVNCGSGRDSVVADRIDVVSRNCERVRRRGG